MAERVFGMDALGSYGCSILSALRQIIVTRLFNIQ